MKQKYQVVIVGGGPVGVGLSVDLGLRGISCLVIERHKIPQRIPKGQSLGQRTLEHFLMWGIEKELRNARVMPPSYPIGGLIAYGSFTSGYWYAPPGREMVRKYFAVDNERLPQYQTEGVLRAKQATLPSVETCFGWSMEKVEQDANGVRVTIAERDGTGRATIEADYVVGCDGSHSQTREQVGITRGGKEHDQVMVLAVFRSKELHEHLKRFPERSTYRVMHPDTNGYWQFFGRVDVGEGFFFHCPVPRDTTRDNYDFHALLEKVSGFKFKADFDYVGFWDMRIMVAETYQVGRVLIAGDAAHSHPPYGGYGLNSGLEDARNLGWKLAAVLQDWGGPDLIPSYSNERHPIFKETGDDFIGKRIEAERQFAQRYNPAVNKAEFEEAWGKLSEVVSERIHTYEPNYEASKVIVNSAGGPNTAHGKHMIKARAGHHLTPRVLSSGRNVYDEIDCLGFSLIALDADDAMVEAFTKAAAAAKIPLKVVRDGYSGERTEWESRLILARPDHYVVWTGDKLDRDAAAIFATAVGKKAA